MCLVVRVVCAVVVSVARVATDVLRLSPTLFVGMSVFGFALMLDSRERGNTVRVHMPK